MRIPVAITLAGGYAVRVEDTVEIHANTWRAAEASLASIGWRHHASSHP
jgi:hypothetical protein